MRIYYQMRACTPCFTGALKKPHPVKSNQIKPTNKIYIKYAVIIIIRGGARTPNNNLLAGLEC